MKTCLLTLLFIVLFNPLFFAGTYGGGSGTSGSPYLISSALHLAELQSNTTDWASGIYFRQTVNITVSGEWTPIGNSTTKFQGSYNGDGYYVTGVSINQPGTIGNWAFFGYTNGATIQNLGVTNVVIYGRGNSGGLIGYALSTTVSSCYTTGTVRNEYDYIGGLIGESNSSTISQCYTTCTVQGNQNATSSGYVGGFVGRTEGGASNISDCYQTVGAISGDQYVGGFIGVHAAGTISNCYSTGSVSGSPVGGFVAVNSASINNSFWDTQTSGQASSTGGTGKTTAEMKTLSTFTDAGWSGSIWNLDAGYNNGYPHLDWQNLGGSPLPVELVSFTANIGTDFITLHWQTATEVDNYGFEVEKAVGSASASLSTRKQSAESSWEKIGFIAGAGNSSSPKNYSFIDNGFTTGKHFYRLKQINTDGSFEYSNEIEIKITQPEEFALYQNYPNPFNPITKIKFAIPSIETSNASTLQPVILKVYDILGNVIVTLVNEPKKSGMYEVEWNASDLATGIYLYRLQSNGFVTVRKALIIK